MPPNLDAIAAAFAEAFPQDGHLLARLAGSLLGPTAVAVPTPEGIVRWAAANDRLTELLAHAHRLRPDSRGLAAALDLCPASEQVQLQAPLSDRNRFLRPDQVMVRSLLVCRVDRDQRPHGTGFLVGPNLIVTNYHVLDLFLGPDAPSITGRVDFRFDFREVETGMLAGRTYLPAAKDWLVAASRTDELDYVVVRTDGTPGRDRASELPGAPQRGWVTAVVEHLADGLYGYVVQHPRGDPLRFADGPVLSRYALADHHVVYAIDTADGSSGSPCFTSDGSVLALHRGTTEVEGNQGVFFRAILDHAADAFKPEAPPPDGAEGRRPDDPTSPPGPADSSRDLRLGQVPEPTNPWLIPRPEYVARLFQYWLSGETNAVQIVASGGMGKSTVVWTWLEELRAQRYPGITRAFSWSFFYQGADDGFHSGSAFLEGAAEYYGVAVKPGDTLAKLGRHVGLAFLKVGGLLILDGVEPLQESPGKGGRFEDDGLRSLLDTVRTSARPPDGQPRLLVLTTRWALPDRAGMAKIELGPLTPVEGGQLLGRFHLDGCATRLKASDGEPYKPGNRSEFERVATEYGGHPLALTLLAGYLLTYHNGELSQYRTLREPAAEDRADAITEHAHRVMEGYDRLFESHDPDSVEGNCLRVLRLLGLFDHPAPRRLLDELMEGDPIPGFTDGLNKARFDRALVRLRGLAVLPMDGSPDKIDAHPLLRQHFSRATRLPPGPFDDQDPDHIRRKALDDARRKAQWRLYDLLCRRPKDDQPANLPDMFPLLDAVAHGVQAGLASAAFSEVYLRRIQRHPERYLISPLGAVPRALAVISRFFPSRPGEPQDWEHPVADLSTLDQVLVLLEASELHLATKGWAAHEVGVSSRAALALAGSLPASEQDPNMLMAIRLALWSHLVTRGRLADALKHAEQLTILADNRSVFARVNAARARGATYSWAGRHIEADRELSECVTLLPELPPTAFSRDAIEGLPVMVHAHHAMNLCVLGCPDKAVSEADAARAAARSWSQFAYCYALTFSCGVFANLRDTDRLRETTQELLDTSLEHGYLGLRPIAKTLSALAEAWAEVDPLPALERMDGSIKDWQASGAGLTVSFYRALGAEAYIRLGRPIEAGQWTEAAFAAVETGDRYYLPEVHRVRAELSLLSKDWAAAEQGIDEADRLASDEKCGALLLQLRAAGSRVRLARTRTDLGADEAVSRLESAVARLRETIARFTEGSETKDLREARALLDPSPSAAGGPERIPTSRPGGPPA
ncbi:MAG TPA: trypsin-like peptidase domain-containing protein [Gemmataceae bacterium]|nr:trypsin-like peptidase domain-containing protein [Gemmataceae bacterium]